MQTNKECGFAHATLIVFSVTLLLSASIMFAVQPMVGKMLLPLVGGTPAGWIVAMAFFQIMLLVGYLLAHIMSRLSVARHGIAYVLLLIAGLAFLPLSLEAHAGRIGGQPGPFDVFILLTFAVAVPFIALSATSSTVQRLFTATAHSSAGDPYFLYAASNLGSFAGLLLYPLAVEPLLGLAGQARLLSAAYILLMVAAAGCILVMATHTKKKSEHDLKAGKPGRAVNYKRYLEWMFLAFIPSSLLLGVTIYITTDVMSVPMVWVLPLALYLLTFVIAFSKKQYFSKQDLWTIYPFVVLAAIMLLSVYKPTWVISWSGILFFLTIFTVAALTFHLQLVSLRPLEDNSRDLTGFYLMMSVGGALGGVLNAFIIPNITNRMIELPLILIASLLLHPALRIRSFAGICIILSLGFSLLLLNTVPPSLFWGSHEMLMALLVFGLALAILSIYMPALRKAFSLQGLMALSAVLFAVFQFSGADTDEVFMHRNFYGTIRVVEKTETLDHKKYLVRYMTHGTTVHGQQVLEEGYRQEPVSYFSRSGPLGEIFKLFAPKKVAVIGLGAGSMNCYNAPGRTFTFIEIDQAVVDVAREYFTFLKDCAGEKEPRIIVGDGRLELAKLEGETFDLIILDAFSSDIVPAHLLTVEALEIYKRHLSEKGLLLMHISNRYFVLEKVLASIAARTDMQHRLKMDRTLKPPFVYPSKWFALSKDAKALQRLEAQEWTTVPEKYHAPAWTDDYTNIMSVIHFQ